MSDFFTKKMSSVIEIFSDKIYNMFVSMMLVLAKACVKNDMAWIVQSRLTAAILLTSQKTCRLCLHQFPPDAARRFIQQQYNSTL